MKIIRLIGLTGKLTKTKARLTLQLFQNIGEGNLDLCSTAKVYVDKIQINAHFFDDSELENDIDPKRI